MKFALMAGLLALAGAAQAASIYSNGPVVGSNGLSVLTSPNSTYGWNVNAGLGYSAADDFTVPDGQTWTVTGFDFYGYQTGATSNNFTSAVWSIVSGDVNTGTVMASGTASLTDGGRVGYRVTSTTTTDTSRAIYDLQANVTSFSLAAGTYWLTWSLNGTSLYSGPWQPPTSDGAAGNAMQNTGTGFIAMVDTGSGLVPNLPFSVNGTVSAVPEATPLAMLLAGGLAVVGIARRRSRVD